MAKESRKRFFKFAGWTLGIYSLMACFTSYRYVHPQRIEAKCPPELSEDVVGGTPVWISPSLREGKRPKVAFVLAHGYGGSRNHWREIAVRLNHDGFGVVVPAMPGHDRSPQPICTFGRDEAKVVASCARWASLRTECSHVVAVGVSMGGSASWLASATETSIGAIISEGAFARFDQATDDWFRRLFPGGPFVLAPVRWLAQLQTGIDPATIRPVDAATRWVGKPCLVIHGDRDGLLPRSHAEQLATAAKAATWIVPNCGHARVCEVAFEEYVRRIEEMGRRLSG